MRDLNAVFRKFTHIMYPRKNSELLKDCKLILRFFFAVSSKVEIKKWFFEYFFEIELRIVI